MLWSAEKKNITTRKHLSFQVSYTKDDRKFHLKYLTWKDQLKNLLHVHMDMDLKGGEGKQRQLIHYFFQDLQKVSKYINQDNLFF